MLLKMGDKQYTIKYTFNSMCLIEDLLGMGIQEMVLNKIKLSSLKTIRAFLTAGLFINHPEIDELEAGELIQKYINKGGLTIYQID
jgi:hypothetical protein